MAVKIIPTEIVSEILQILGLKRFARPYAAMIDPGDFGTVSTYIPLFPQEYKQLPPNLQAHVYVVAPGQYGLISLLPRTFEAPDGGKATEVFTVHNVWGKMVKVSYGIHLQSQVIKQINSISKLFLLKLLNNIMIL